MTEIQDLDPQEAKEWYVDSRREELSDATIRAHKYRISPFVRFCDEKDIEFLSDLNGRDFDRYKIWRRENGDLNNVTLNTQLSTLRVFIKWAEKVDAVPRGFHEYVDPPSMAPQEDVSEDVLDDEDAADILRNLRKYDYASRNHALMELLWHTGMRTGAIRGIDLDHIDHDAMSIELRHKPDDDTPLKNGKAGERTISIKGEVYDVISDYIDRNRKNATEGTGRKPLFSTSHGRISRQAIRRAVYGMTRPCIARGSCPHNEDLGDCEYAQNVQNASKCPSTVSPHAVRKGAITWSRLNDVPIDAVSGRMDVSPSILKKHYDKRTEEQEMENRRRYFDSI